VLCGCLCVLCGVFVQAFVVFCYYMYDNLMLRFFPVRFLLFVSVFRAYLRVCFCYILALCCGRHCTACFFSLFVLVSFVFFLLDMVNIIP